MTTTHTSTTEVNDSMRNGVDTATLFATLDAVKQGAPGGHIPAPSPTTSGRAAPQPHHHHRVLRRRRGAHPGAHLHL
jgi:hypothetical protein